MRPLRLVMQAFGPYRGREIIDFAELGTNRLFLIHGETGSGKTSILDAIVFALYGDTSGGERQGVQMRCESADAWSPTEVSLDFSLGARSFRVTRRPRQMVAARQSGALVARAAEASLWETTATGLLSDGRLLASRLNEVNQLVRGLLGFSSEQFRQVVVLPQGKFRELLAARSDEREEIMRQLFRTEECAALEAALSERAKAVLEERKVLQTERRVRLTTAGAESDEDLCRLLEEARVLAERTACEAEEAGRVWKEASAALAEAEKASAAYQKVLAARAALDQLAAVKPAMDLLEDRLSEARRAAAVVPYWCAAQEAEHRKREAAEQLAAARLRLEQALARSEEAAERLRREESRASEKAGLEKRLHRLSDMLPLVRAWQAAVEERDAAAKRLAATAVELEEAQSACAMATSALEEARERATVAEAARSRLKALETLLVEAARRTELCLKREEAADRLEVRRKERSHAVAEFSALEEALADARKELARLEAAWRRGRAALLARELTPGAPCPVCGSTVHPAPAVSSESVVEDAALDKANAQVASLQDARDKARELLAEKANAESEASSELATLEAALPSGLETEQARREEETLRQEQSKLTELLETYPEPAEEVERARAALAATRVRLEEAQENNQRAAADASGKTERARALASTVPEDLRSAAALERALDETRLQAATLDRALETARSEVKVADEEAAAARSSLEVATEAAVAAETASREAVETLDAVLARQGFADWETCALRIMDEEELLSGDTEVATYKQQLAQAEGRLQEALAALRESAGVRGEVGVLRERAAAAEAEYKAAQGRASEAALRLRQLKELQGELLALDRKGAEIDAHFRVIGRLAEVATGQGGGERVSFQRWVLGAFLDEVLATASQRLLTMSKGRYRLERQRTGGDRRRAAGLDLAVFDGWSDRSRPAVTLSGGESFLAALALALGLAETVQEQAGGTRLETVFIDEGFGALDPDSLDLAVDVLLELKDTGRLVGVISHVPELREVIDARLEVRGGPAGSSTRFVVP